MNFLLVNQQKISQLKLVEKKVKENWLNKIFGDPRNFGGSDPTNESQE